MARSVRIRIKSRTNYHNPRHYLESLNGRQTTTVFHQIICKKIWIWLYYFSFNFPLLLSANHAWKEIYRKSNAYSFTFLLKTFSCLSLLSQSQQPLVLFQVAT
ncbi:hypothetical protein OESDEN_23344 [Oesophagostomum dentatum]|uniref:Uncharacterized protein n=1 Tax=Oesophagostomum dentatum TaxID=61180 RepID=A0A0B1RZF6_OESDE|nr:hypothetical protein OESDEN_23344 [Oesophagostomum dentatum]